MSYRLGVDTGGTFTDIALIHEQTGEVHVAKVPSTPHDPSEAVINGVREIVSQTGIDVKNISFFIHGSTVATNALLERKGAKTALLTTKGFRDVLEIGRQSRPKLYDFKARKKVPFVSRDLRIEVSERIKANGEVLEPLDPEEIREIAHRLKREGVQSVAICLINSYMNDTHENMIRQALQEEYPEAYVTLSSEVLPEFKEYERTSTVAANAYVLPKMKGYLNRLVGSLKEIGVRSELYIMQSNGGIITAESAMHTPARTVLSGPAGGILAGLFIVETTPYKDLITIDMGGTSLDTALIEKGRPQYTTMSEVEGSPIKLPMIEMHTIGSGGGSIAWIDVGGALRVGPQSAGAVPGPVSYNKGGMEPTVTDANVILGRINPGYILNGKMKMNLELARQVMKEKIADPLGITIEEAAEGILKVVNANMIRGIRVISIEKGHDPRNFSLVAFGGAGPVHAVEIGKELGCQEIIIPPNPGITCAMGMLMADVRHDFVQTVLSGVAQLKLDDANDVIARLAEEARGQLHKEGFADGEIHLQVALDLRYLRQAYEIDVPIRGLKLNGEMLEQAVNDFHRMHHKIYGFSREEETVELVNIRLIAIGAIPKIRFDKREGGSETQEALPSRQVFFDGRFVATPVYNRSGLRAGAVVEGPAIFEQLDSTIVIHPGQKAETDDYGNLLIHLYNA
ncbi:hydantoinase/oxoprolinase family protein [Paenibacillus doosanensis]|uniref:Acetophenone carboxylase gamma subunit n=1 Tax=Paenibacillus konkukensis TaxID=2020716 RepID=A0ABY4RV07_9BACL|nr:MULTISPECIES: hydantoinase/oxoprolinase family protein [Paenibacillus]MCS7464230.1 hydantoinase/oxoprolinase family protein [Paenibacillus doosanensis]UQZ85579.1 Acetophenone carboxylase gamma subunit [Paenibacillus konkukensis]